MWDWVWVTRRWHLQSLGLQAWACMPVLKCSASGWLLVHSAYYGSTSLYYCFFIILCRVHSDWPVVPSAFSTAEYFILELKVIIPVTPLKLVWVFGPASVPWGTGVEPDSMGEIMYEIHFTFQVILRTSITGIVRKLQDAVWDCMCLCDRKPTGCPTMLLGGFMSRQMVD